ncbi:hypothetical protein CC78DRAFT_573898 [Lojkania enalia]|uniref:Uncharacterized protein n=1 Tax=Lojkania enalia TaxID=147567 RepID=A0A9P4NCJ6_9PLEO|nr:hypothetical protein CC78DRAFT_573898 [Didymosphaeria enalia]
MVKDEPGVQNTMQLAEILSDLTSLRVCDPAAALALVSVRPSSIPKSTSTPTENDDQDPDLKKAKDLVELHYEVKERQRKGELSGALEEARKAVGRAVGH